MSQNKGFIKLTKVKGTNTFEVRQDGRYLGQIAVSANIWVNSGFEVFVPNKGSVARTESGSFIFVERE